MIDNAYQLLLVDDEVKVLDMIDNYQSYPKQEGFDTTWAGYGNEALLLLVDDEVKVLDMIDNYLKQEGFDTTWAGNGNEALELFRMQSFDLVVLDLMLSEHTY